MNLWSFGVVIYEMWMGLNFATHDGDENHRVEPKNWCNSLANVCRNGGDLVRMVALDVNQREHSRALHASSSFPIVTDSLPIPYYTNVPERSLPERGQWTAGRPAVARQLQQPSSFAVPQGTSGLCSLQGWRVYIGNFNRLAIVSASVLFQQQVL